MDIDIRKPSRFGRVKLERPHKSQGSSSGPSSNPSNPDSPRIAETKPAYNEPISDGEDDEEYLTMAATNESQFSGLPESARAQAEAARLFREKNAELEKNRSSQASGSIHDDQPAANGKPNGNVAKKQYDRKLDIDPLAPAGRFDTNYHSMLDSLGLQKLFRIKAQREQEEDEDDEEDQRAQQPEMVRFKAPAGKLISVPIRIEPKVIFANEVWSGGESSNT